MSVCLDFVVGSCVYICTLTHTHTHIHSPPSRFLEEEDDIGYVMYDLDDMDINWLESVNQKRKFRG